MQRSVGLGATLALAAACAACSPRGDGSPAKLSPPVAVAAAHVSPPSPVPELAAPAPAAASFPAVEMESTWRGFGVSSCAYLAPKGDYIAEDGGVDVLFHFHAGQMSERAMRDSGLRAVFVSCGYGVGTTVYARAFQDPTRFGRMVKKLTRAIGDAVGREDVHLRRLALASWSAGYAAIGRILAVPEWYEATDAVILLDSLHARYVRQRPLERGADQVDVRRLDRFVRFARDAARGAKTMAITHSSIVPPNYASTSEATAALLSEVGVSAAPVDETNDRGMRLSLRADEGGLHVRGFRGIGPRDHVDHLHLIGEALRSWLVPRWYTPDGERP